MTQHKNTRLHRTGVVLVALALVATALLSFAPAMGSSHRDPEPERWIDENDDPAENRFVLNVTGDFHQVADPANGNWAAATLGSVVAQTAQGNESFWISNRTYEGVRVELDVTAPLLTTGLFGFTLNHRLPSLDFPDVYRTIILDWSDSNQTRTDATGTYTSEQGFTLYYIDTDGDAFDDDYRLGCFWEKHVCPLKSPLVAGDLQVLDNWTHGAFSPGNPNVPDLGYEPGAEYRFEILYYNEDISPGSYGILVRVTGGEGHYKNGRDVIDWRPTGNEPWLPDGFDIREFVEPEHLGFYTFQQADVSFGSPDQVTYVDVQRPKISVSQTCNVATINGWCTDTATVDVTVQEDGSGIASVDCLLTAPGEPDQALPDCDLATFPVDLEGAFLDIEAFDHGGNKRTLTHNLRIDSTPPILSLATQCQGAIVNGWCNGDVNVEKNLQAISGASHYDCEKSLSGGAFQSTSCAPVSEDGAYDFRVTGYSKVLLASNPETVSFLRDATEPQGEFLAPSEGCLNIDGTSAGCTGLVTVAYGAVPVTVEAADPTVNGVAAGMARVEFLDENGLFAVIEGDGDDGLYETTWDTDRLGEHVITARLVDDAGNVEVLQLTVDVVIPGL